MTAGTPVRANDDNMSGMSINGCRCNQCRHVKDSGMSCRAFRRGIPMEIISGAVQHIEPFPGDRGIRFEPREAT